MSALNVSLLVSYRVIITIYVELLRSLSSSYRTMASILIVDTPGFRNPSSCGRNTGATFEDFCHNYVQERLQLLFHDSVFSSELDLYAQVNTNYKFIISELYVISNL